MALIVEDGSIVAGAESYASVAYADAYFANRPSNPNSAVWAALNTAGKEGALREGTDHMMQAFRLAWQGNRVSQYQVLDWPRYGVTRDKVFAVLFTIVPDEIQRGCVEYAVRASAGPLVPDLERPESKIKIGPLEIDYSDGSPWQTTYQSVVNVFSMYLQRGGSSSGMARLIRV